MSQAIQLVPTGFDAAVGEQEIEVSDGHVALRRPRFRLQRSGLALIAYRCRKRKL